MDAYLLPYLPELLVVCLSILNLCVPSRARLKNAGRNWWRRRENLRFFHSLYLKYEKLKNRGWMEEIRDEKNKRREKRTWKSI